MNCTTVHIKRSATGRTGLGGAMLHGSATEVAAALLELMIAHQIEPQDVLVEQGQSVELIEIWRSED